MVGTHRAARACAIPPEDGCAAMQHPLALARDVNMQVQLHFWFCFTCSCMHAGQGAGPGCVVWECGVALAEYISQHVDRQSISCQTILELGAGPRHCGHCGGPVWSTSDTLTDRDVDLLRSNVECACAGHQPSW